MTGRWDELMLVPTAWRSGRVVRPLPRAVVKRLMWDVILRREPTVPAVPRF